MNPYLADFLTVGIYTGLPQGDRVTSLVAQKVKHLPTMRETQVQSPEEGKGYPLMFWPGDFHGLYSPWVHKESDTTEHLSFFCITENYLNYI